MERIVISVGGSLIVPKGIDVSFLKEFKRALLKHCGKGRKFAVVCGGGRVSREYVAAATRLDHLTDEQKDWMGIYCTRLNAALLKSALGKMAAGDIVTDPTAWLDKESPVLVAAGWKPGWSTDYVAVMLAKRLGVKEVVNMTNTEYVYTADPRKSREAKPIPRMSWKEYNRMFGEKWTPGMNIPFDPVASRISERLKMRVYIIGRSVRNLESLLLGRKFRGTVIG